MATSIIDQTREIVQKYMQDLDPSHDMLHVDRVTRLAIHIATDCRAQGYTVDPELVELAALCHDIGDRKYHHGPETGGDIILQFLTRLGYDTKRAHLVARIVDHVGFRKELGWNDTKDDPAEVEWRNHCIELHAVQDADKLDAIGAFGVMRCAAYSGIKGTPLFSVDQEPVKNITKEEYEQQTKKNNGTAINHFHEKLFRLKSMMRTSKGKAMAEERDQFMRLFVKQIENEYDLLS
ncbi:hypothetical protein DFQ28_003231 [Apophysomyces sp. BC1034]|nr:hypothetical protein DFQ30_011141 [Apophysomyces sp. BC1015]KAG0179604.1 hypothetical protein DFQ29_001890 [Apophysomyces sp. BC1021]KAG0189586.1 hypothetical protein DFQ28_003231 [Apophysomyces sp. BC1034]